MQKTASVPAFKPFLVEGGRDGKNIFRVIEIEANGVRREHVEKLLEKLPIGFYICTKSSWSCDHINEPLEVYVHGLIVSIYPPKHRIVNCANLDSWGSAEVVGKMHVDNLADLGVPRKGQVRSCIHFSPTVLGIEDWPIESSGEIEVDIFAYPITKTEEVVIKPLSFSKFEVRKLLNLIAGQGKSLTVNQLNDWRELIMFAVASMRSGYENPETPKDAPERVYYKEEWVAISVAKDEGELVKALEGLRSAIEYD
jgi:hypothetical protein